MMWLIDWFIALPENIVKSMFWFTRLNDRERNFIVTIVGAAIIALAIVVWWFI